MKVAHLSSLHLASDPRVNMKECAALIEAGYDVVLVCPHPRDEAVNGVRVHAIPSRRRQRLARVVFSVWDVWRAALREDAGIYHLHDPELLLVGWGLRLRGSAVIYDVHEDLPRQILTKPWIPAPFRRLLSVAAAAIEYVLARGMSGIVAATPQIAARFPARSTTVVQNFAMLDELDVPKPTPYHDRPARFVYIGALARIRGAFEMSEAVARVPGALGARLTMAGVPSHEGLREELSRTPGWDRLEYLGWQTRAEVARHLDAARAGLLLIHPTPNYLESYPVKAFEYMAVGLPFIVSEFPLWRKLFGDVGCAIFVDPFDVDAIARAMTWVLENPADAERMGAKGRAVVQTRFNWQAEVVKLLSFYKQLSVQVNSRMIRARLGNA